MTEYDASHQQNDLLRPPGHRYPSPSTSRGQDRHDALGSLETGGSSHSGSLINSTWTTDATLAQRPSHDGSLPDAHSNERRARDHRSSRRQNKPQSHKHKSTGAFLLSDPFDEPGADDLRPRKNRGRSTGDKNKDKETTPRHSHEHAPGTRQSGVGLGLPSDLKKGNGSAAQSPGTPPRHLGTDRRSAELLQVSPGMGSSHSSPSSVDMDSTQIVSMALNLSEGRRLAQRRILSQTLPPRLAPLPTDNTVAGTLRQQLQQQRRVSRTASPGHEKGSGGRAVSSGKSAAALQPAFEPAATEGSYQYNFSSSTWARAQKAKDYMELLAQYRRVLDLLPPLKPNSLSKVPTSELSPSMPMSLDTVNATGQIGRPYDPLQYVRNRKVRARERQTIDGESQGFGDVSRVTDWVDDVAKWVATRQIRTPGSAALPPFSGADVFSMDTSPSTHVSRSAAPIVKPKRPRNDWMIEPADMLADIYWLEQDDHKRLVEDRHWRRVFPQDADLYRPLSRSTNDASPALGLTSSPAQQAIETEQFSGRPLSDVKMYKGESEQVPSSTRGKARQKLQEIRGLHRHSAAHGDKHHHHHSRLRGRSDSTSSSSNSDSQDRSRKSMSGDTGRDILEKQMMEMMAREAQETKEDDLKLAQEPELRRLRTQPSDIISQSQITTPPDSTAVSRQHSRRGSRIDTSDADEKKFVVGSGAGSPPRLGRESLEVPPFQRGRRMSIGSESSAPNSPDIRASRRDNYFIPAIGADLSPASSRAGSPSRNPLSRVKQIFRDRSRDRAPERYHEALSSEKESSAELVSSNPPSRISSPPELFDRWQTHSRTNSVGPDVKLTTRTTGDSHKSHRKSNSIRLDPGSGLRSLFKGPRIDSVLKSGVSRMSELLWKKESEAEDSDSSTSLSGESDDETRGRRRHPNSLSPTPSLRGLPGQMKHEKHYLDVMPPFVSSSEQRGNDHSRSDSLFAPLSKPTSNRSTRFEILKPPRIDISMASDTADPGDHAVDGLDSEARVDRIREVQSAGDRRPSLSIRPPNGREKSFSTEHTPISRREVARLRAMVLSSGVMAMEISRRAHRPTILTPNASNDNAQVLEALGNKVSWPEIASLAPDDQRDELLSEPVSQADLFPVTADVLRTAIRSSRESWKSEAEAFKHHTRAELIEGRIESLRARIQLDLSSMTRAAAEEADEVGGDLVDGQRLKVKVVVDGIDKLSRRRRRRFRWVRRAGWLAVEWALVGFMWYVWFVVMIARIVLGIGRGFVGGVRWLLWL
ncbi:hypothetical protein M406DRAFT_330913 [Cryphonectria parasitica EP155]|uniref:Uncharacterized protein n=1 Tax=Cryphonectria parasitica (strain ATCC 38755 / EP155) TaxID=660469 RepID=A0A9P5CMX8_CRYP1|nr:uncharacterized protein M406DRAFT_330913 [Cryphonectria parasitica EP155]KAF3764583.1 hypothetical protein M406DRAFT_330913 [Cryphonectria parasitica EP155]